MKRIRLIFVLTLLLPGAARADATTEAELRAALQNATAQIATLEDQVAHLQAAQAPELTMIHNLQAQLQAAPKPVAPPPESDADKAKQAAALAALDRQLAARSSALVKSQSAYQQAASQANAVATQNGQLSTQLIAANKRIGSCDAKNAELYKIGNQVLDAYAHKDDLFGAIANREPFIGFKRVQLQNIVQNDQDKLYDNQITP